MQDRFEDLRTFVAVVQARSLASAARRLNVAKSAVSRRVQELENRLGAQLLNRTTRTLSLTEAGRQFFERATALLADLEEAENIATSATREVVGKLRISAPMTFGAMHMAPVICHFMEKNPRLSVEMILDDRRVDLVADGYDLAVRIAQLEDSNLAARRIAPIRRTVCASPRYLRRYGTPKQPADLIHHRGISYTNVDERRYWHFVHPQTGEEQFIDVRSPLKLNNGDAMREAAIAGYGLTALPTFITHQAIAAAQLVPLLLPYELPAINMYAVFPSGRNTPGKVRAFVDFMVDRFGDSPYWDRDVFGDAA